MESKAVEGVNFIRQRKGESDAEFNKRKKAFRIAMIDPARAAEARTILQYQCAEGDTTIPLKHRPPRSQANRCHRGRVAAPKT